MVPKHLGIIPDGNRRWATQKGLPTLKGHQEGVKAFKTVSRHAFNQGVESVTYYAFSAENWKRSEEEVGYLMKLFRTLLFDEIGELFDEGIRFRFIGSRKGLDAELLKALDHAEAKTAANSRGTLSVCLNYGGEHEIADAAARLIEQGVAASDVTPERLAAELYAPELPSLDLVIRCSGEHRLSGFMLWRASYAELYFTDVFWPDFGPEDLDAALADYARRNRRFGG